MAESSANNSVITYKSWAATSQGFSNLTLIDREIPAVLGDHEIAVQVRASGLNPVDYKACEWGSAFSPFPRDIGVDVSGVVIRAGAKVDTSIFQLNNTVVYAHTSLRQSHGPLAHYAIVDSRYVTIIPSDLLSPELSVEQQNEILTDLAAIPCAGYTAYQAVCVKLKLPIHADPTNIVNNQIHNIVVTAGAGGVGNFALQLLREWRANNFTAEEQQSIRIITTASSRNFEFVKQLGATHVIDYNDSTQTLSDAIKAIIPKGDSLDAWIDLVGGESVKQALDTISFRGEIVVVVENADYTNRLFSPMLSIHNVALGQAYALGSERHKKDLQRYGQIFLDLYRAKKLIIRKTVIGFEEVKDALQKIKERHVQGKVVLKI